jgi:hypothetical protein
MNNCKILKLNPIKTEGKPGLLTEIDIHKICIENNIDFKFYKCFYLNDLDNLNNHETSRGNHSNINAKEFLFCLKGSFDIKLHDGKTEIIFEIKENEGIYINKNVWISYFNFVNSVIMAFVSVDISDKESCYNFDEFLKSKN